MSELNLAGKCIMGRNKTGSALELLKLIDGAVTEDEDEIVEGGSHEK